MIIIKIIKSSRVIQITHTDDLLVQINTRVGDTVSKPTVQ